MVTDYSELIPTIEYFIERKCAPSWNIRNEHIPYHDLTYVISGKSTYFIDDVPYHLKQGDMIYLPKGSLRHAVTAQDHPMHCYAFNFNVLLNNEAFDQLPLPSTFSINSDSELMRLFKDYARLWLEKRSGFLLKARAFLILILHRLIYNHTSGSDPLMDPRIHKVKEYILSHYNMKIDIEHLSNMVDLNPVYFGSLFHKHNQCTVKEYINTIRINNAENLLLNGGNSVSEAAEICGFNDIFYFSRVFKTIKGFPPSAVHKKIRSIF